MNQNPEDGDRIAGLGQLARRQRPQRDLWPGIESRLRPRRSRYPLAQFALAASLVAGLAGVFSLQLGRAPLPGAASGAGPAPLTMTAVAPLRHDSRAIVRANLAIVRQAEFQLRKALSQDPDSAALRELLASTENRGRGLRALL